MANTKIIDILSLGLITGVVAILTSVMGISGTIIGSVVTSIAVELLKTFMKPVKEKISDLPENEMPTYGQPSQSRIQDNYYRPRSTRKQKSSYTSFINTKTLFIFPLIVILIIELIHFLGAIGIIPYGIFFKLEDLTNWTLFTTIGYSLIVMGLYPIFSKKLGTHHGIILIIVGIVELIIGHADTNASASLIFGLFSSLKEFVNIAIILAILYTVLTIPEEIKESKHEFIDNYSDSDLRNPRNNHDMKYYDNRNYPNNRHYNAQYRKQKNRNRNNNYYNNYFENYDNNNENYYYYYEE